MPPRYWIVNYPVVYAPGVWSTWYRENCVALGWPPSSWSLEGYRHNIVHQNSAITSWSKPQLRSPAETVKQAEIHRP